MCHVLPPLFPQTPVGADDDAEIAENFAAITEYIRSHAEITNVLISGGDAFMNSNARIEQFLEALTPIEASGFYSFLRTRTPVTYPQRINDDPALIDILSKYNKQKQLYVVTQFNHPMKSHRNPNKRLSCCKKQA